MSNKHAAVNSVLECFADDSGGRRVDGVIALLEHRLENTVIRRVDASMPAATQLQ